MYILLNNGNTLHRLCSLVSHSGSCQQNETALITAFCQSLNSNIRQQMAIYDNVIVLESFIQRSTQISQWPTACSLDQPVLQTPTTTTSVTPPAPEPMQIDSTPIQHRATKQIQLVFMPISWFRGTPPYLMSIHTLSIHHIWYPCFPFSDVIPITFISFNLLRKLHLQREHCPVHHVVKSTRCPSRNKRPWRSILRRLSS